MTPLFGAHIDGNLKPVVEKLRSEAVCNVVQTSFELADQMKPYGELIVPLPAAEIAFGWDLSLFFHGPITVNMATDTNFMAQTSQRNVAGCMALADSVGAKGVVIHCGSWKTGSWEEGLGRMGRRIARIVGEPATAGPRPYKTQLLIENTAGKGTTMGSDLTQFCKVILALKEKVGDRVGICLDLAHSWGAGYDPKETLDILEAAGLTSAIGLVHFNGADPTVEQGSGRDRHRCTFGDCAQGADAMREAFLRLSSLAIPMVVERGDDNVQEVIAGNASGVLVNDLRIMRDWSIALPQTV